MTERAEASEALSTQIVNSLTAGLLVVDRQGLVQTINPAGRKMLGITASVGGSPIAALSPAAAPLAAVINECLTTGESIVRRTVEVPHASEVTHLGVTATKLGQTEGDAAGGVICLFSDLTAVIELEEQLRLKETLARLGELTAGIAHEFRNGLATIHGYGKLIDPAALPAQYKPYIEGIRQETDALGQVVTNFLNFARPTQLSLATYDLAALVQRAADDLKNEVQQLGGEIVVSGQFGQVDADDVLLRQAFSNLLRNAIEACQPSGVTPRVRVEGALDTAQNQARVSVHDNGPGLDPNARDRIFRPFFTTKKTGTGLGLALVQKIVVTHNGRITAGSSPSGGACFQVTLPLA
jgi:PAS domain S-box-containing protein